MKLHQLTLLPLALLLAAGGANCTKRYFGVKEGTPPDTLVAVWRDWPIHIAEVNGESGSPGTTLTKVPFYTTPGPITVRAYYNDTERRAEAQSVTFAGAAGEVWLLCSHIQDNKWKLVITKDQAACPLMRFHELRAKAYGEPMKFDPTYKPVK